MTGADLSLVCFAVKEEATYFKPFGQSSPAIQVCLTGMGQRNAERALLSALVPQKPRLVLSCGFAGGLRPDLTTGTVLFDADSETALQPLLVKAGACPGRFFCSDRVATTSAQKRELWERSQADAVEMESQAIRAICAKRSIPSATVRVILDTVAEDLPLDFNQLMDHKHQLQMRKLIAGIICRPWKLVALIRFQRQCQAAARSLGAVLNQLFRNQDQTARE